MSFKPSSFFNFYVAWFRPLPYLAVFFGAVFFLVGTSIFLFEVSFTARAEKAELLVVSMETQVRDNGLAYRPVFEATSASGQTQSYSEQTWINAKLHDQGDVVTGFVDWSNGKMRSVSTTDWIKSFGKLFALIGGACFMLGSAYLWVKRKRTE